MFPTLFGMLYCTVTDVYAYASWQFLVSRYLMLFGACYVSYVALKVLESSRARTRLEAALIYADRSFWRRKSSSTRWPPIWRKCGGPVTTSGSIWPWCGPT